MWTTSPCLCKGKYQNKYNTTFHVRLLSKASQSPRAFDKSELQCNYKK